MNAIKLLMSAMERDYQELIRRYLALQAENKALREILQDMLDVFHDGTRSGYPLKACERAAALLGKEPTPEHKYRYFCPDCKAEEIPDRGQCACGRP